MSAPSLMAAHTFAMPKNLPLQLVCADQTIVNSILSVWTTHILIFFVIALTRIHLSNGLSFQKMTLFCVRIISIHSRKKFD